jgi:hypothetical protein
MLVENKRGSHIHPLLETDLIVLSQKLARCFSPASRSWLLSFLCCVCLFTVLLPFAK